MRTPASPGPGTRRITQPHWWKTVERPDIIPPALPTNNLRGPQMKARLLASFLILVAAVDARAQCEPALENLSDGTAIATPVIISEINPGTGGYVEFFNTTASDFNMTGWWLCSPFIYSAVGAIVIPAGGYATVVWPATFVDTDAGGEILLYKSSSFGTSNDIVDYICWGTNPHGSRQNQANTVGKWVGTACAGALTNGCIHRITGTPGTGPASYDVAAAPSPSNCTPTNVRGSPAYPAMELKIGPNPFSALATIQFKLSSSATVSAAVYSVTGQRVRTLDARDFSVGTGRMLWDGTDDTGRKLPSGTYLVRVNANNTSAVKRVTILR